MNKYTNCRLHIAFTVQRFSCCVTCIRACQMLERPIESLSEYSRTEFTLYYLIHVSLFEQMSTHTRIDFSHPVILLVSVIHAWLHKSKCKYVSRWHCYVVHAVCVDGNRFFCILPVVTACDKFLYFSVFTGWSRFFKWRYRFCWPLDSSRT